MPPDAFEMPDVRDGGGGARPTALYVLYTDLDK